MQPSAARRVTRLLAFARHIPPQKIVRRVDLTVRRWLRDHLPWRANHPAAAPGTESVQRPLFPPRETLAPGRDGDQWTFTFLNRPVAMTGQRIDWCAPSPDGADQLWRTTLHAMEYLEALDDAAFVAVVEDWIANNPVHRRGAWRDSWHSFSLSIRVVIWLTELARRGDTIGAGTRRDIERSCAEQLRFLARNLETDLGGNHLIKNITALIVGGTTFSGDEAKGWLRRGVSLLAGERERQVLPDGMHHERSPSYHNQVFADLLQCRHALREDPLGGRLDEALARMAQACADLAHPDGSVALFNDAGLSMARRPADCLAAYAKLFGDAPTPRKTFAFMNAGLFGHRAGSSYCVVDCGRVAPDDLPAHGHGDILSFEWSVAGQRIIVDKGVYEYIAGARRTASRAASSHNTLCFEGADQADFFGAFRCGRRPNVRVRAWEPCEDGFVLEGSHDGFAHLPGQPLHSRRFSVSPTTIDIVDRIEGASDRVARVGFLLHPDVRVIAHHGGVRLQVADVTILVTASVAIDIVPDVWWPDMGVEHRTRRMVLTLSPGCTAVETRLRVEA